MHKRPNPGETMPPAGHKRSVSIAGHATSVTLEQPFWRALQQIAADQGLSVATLIQRIDTARADKADAYNLSSALRLYVLESLQARLHARDDARQGAEKAPAST
jgi:predicted DNA-binding ribbon-helix-helix protein